MTSRHLTISLYTLLLFAVVVCATILWFCNWMSNGIAREEQQKMELLAKATRLIAQESIDEGQTIDILLQIIQTNTTIPVIVTNDSNEVISTRNIAAPGSTPSDEEIDAALARMRNGGRRIDISLGDGTRQTLYYSDSNIISQLSYFPFIEILLAVVIVLVAYVIIRQRQRSEQDKVWIGLARETAHQLGTPITALLGWTELLESGDIDASTAAGEIRSDTDRLRSIADRFSKIGSMPELSSLPLSDTIRQTVSYLQPRLSSSIDLRVGMPDNEPVIMPHSPVLIGWVIENLCRNAVDAIDGIGSITINIATQGRSVVVDVTDTGKGMTRNVARHIFDAGFTTKQRGWGIGLALAKRIVGEYHHGRIFVAHTEPGAGTTIRMVFKSRL